MEKFSKAFDIIFVIVAILCLIEFICIKGMFTWILSVGALILFGIIESILLLIRKEYHKTILLALFAIALCSGYLSLL